ncbi:MAG: 4-hydroxy-tetrahydrodipicolinate synthase [Enterobacteriaceae bacterium]
MFSGSIVALVTPMDADGRLDKSSLKKLVDYHVASGTSAIVSVGTTGESATLSHDENYSVVMETLELAAGRIPVIAGTGSNSTAEAISLTRRFDNSGVAGCLSVTPYYNRPTQEGLYQHFKHIAESSDLPQILYNVPKRTGCELAPETIGRLAELPGIVAIKDASDVARVSQILALVDKKFTLLSGDDATSLDFIQLGGRGFISVTANVAAKEMAQMSALALKGEYAAAQEINQRLMPVHHKLFCEASPSPVKWACQRLGLIANNVLRLPLLPLSSKGIVEVEQALKYADLL